MTYVRHLLATTLTLLFLCVAINYTIDPARVYHTDKLQPVDYAESLIKSKHGLWWPYNSFEDREIKMALAKISSNAECVVIGSSHVWQIGNARASQAISNQCISILNLGVSGASIEDDFVLAHEVVKNQKQIKKIILGIDPWTFSYGKEARWSYYKNEYYITRKEISARLKKEDEIFVTFDEVGDKNTAILQKKLRNLLSLEYTMRSITKMQSLLIGIDPRKINPIQSALNEEQGGEYPALLPDGSLIHAQKYITTTKTTPINPHNDDYHYFGGNLNDPKAIDSYKDLLHWIKIEGYEPILLMAPYHQDVLKEATSATAQAISETEPIVRKIGTELNLKVIGTFNPHTAGCLESEFFDAMHARIDCLKKLR